MVPVATDSSLSSCRSPVSQMKLETFPRYTSPEILAAGFTLRPDGKPQSKAGIGVDVGVGTKLEIFQTSAVTTFTT